MQLKFFKFLFKFRRKLYIGSFVILNFLEKVIVVFFLNFYGWLEFLQKFFDDYECKDFLYFDESIFVFWFMFDVFIVEDGCLFISLGFNLDFVVIYIFYMLIYFKKCYVFN